MISNKLGTQPVSKTFFQYLVPTLIGMMLMSINIVIDGIFVGNGVGSVALTSVNIATPVYGIAENTRDFSHGMNRLRIGHDLCHVNYPTYAQLIITQKYRYNNLIVLKTTNICYHMIKVIIEVDHMVEVKHGRGYVYSIQWITVLQSPKSKAIATIFIF